MQTIHVSSSAFVAEGRSQVVAKWGRSRRQVGNDQQNRAWHLACNGRRGRATPAVAPWGFLMRMTWQRLIGLTTLGVATLAGPLAEAAVAAQAECLLVKAATIRVSPSATGQALASAPAGMTLRVLAPEEGWAKVTTPGTAFGAFVPAAACKLTLEEPAVAIPPGPVAAAPETAQRPLTASPQQNAEVGARSVAQLAQVSPAAAPAAPEQKPKKKGGFWKKLGKGLLVGAAIAATAYAAANADSVYYPPVAATTPATAQAASAPAYAPGAATPAAYTHAPAFQTTITGSQQRIGNFSYYNFGNGVTGSSQRIGSFDYHNLSNGLSGTSQDIGSFTYHNFNNGLSGTSQSIGSFRYHNFNNGVSGTSQTIGNTTYTNYNNGGSCTSMQIGGTTSTTCR